MSEDGYPKPIGYGLSGGHIPREALWGVRSRRLTAVCLDLVAVSLLSCILWVALLILSFGMSALLLPPLFPIVAFFYNGLTISGWRRATPGMLAMDLEMRLMNGQPTPFINAAVHAVLFYVSWLLPPLFLFTFINGDKRCLHDVLADVVVLRRAA